MKPWDLFNKLRHVPYIKVGKDLDFFIFSDDSEKSIHVMFQESSSTLDWIINFLFPIVPAIIGGSPYWVALGWWFSWCSARELVLIGAGAFGLGFLGFAKETVTVIISSVFGLVSILAGLIVTAFQIK